MVRLKKPETILLSACNHMVACVRTIALATVIILGGSANASIKVQQAVPPPANEQLRHIDQAYNVFFNRCFTPNLLFKKADQTTLLKLKRTWDVSIKRVRMLIAEQEEPTLEEKIAQALVIEINRQLTALTDYIEHIKDAYCSLQLLTVDPSETPVALVKLQLSHVTLQQTLLLFYQTLTKDLNIRLQQPNKQHATFPLAKALVWALPKTILFPPPRQPQTDEKSVQQPPLPTALDRVLQANWAAQCPLIVTAYLETLDMINQFQYTNPNTHTKEEVSATIDNCLDLITAKQYECQRVINDDTKTLLAILDILTTQLMGIKQTLDFKQSINQIGQEKAALLTIYKKHQILIQSEEFDELKTGLNSTQYQKVDLYLALMSQLFAQGAAPAALFFDFETCCNELKILHKQFNRSGLKWWLCGGNPSIITPIEQMQANVALVLELFDPSSNNQGFMSYILSGDWLPKGLIKSLSPNGNGLNLEFADSLYQKLPVKDLKTAGFYALIAAGAPFVIRKIIRLVEPYLDSSVPKQAEKLLIEPNNAQQRAALLDFVKKNPEIFNKLAERQPKLLDNLAAAVQGMGQD